MKELGGDRHSDGTLGGVGGVQQAGFAGEHQDCILITSGWTAQDIYNIKQQLMKLEAFIDYIQQVSPEYRGDEEINIRRIIGFLAEGVCENLIYKIRNEGKGGVL